MPANQSVKMRTHTLYTARGVPSWRAEGASPGCENNTPHWSSSVSGTIV